MDKNIVFHNTSTLSIIIEIFYCLFYTFKHTKNNHLGCVIYIFLIIYLQQSCRNSAENCIIENKYT